MRDKKFPPQKVFFDGQICDAFEQMKKFVRMAKADLVIIDPYFDDSVLQLIAQKRLGTLGPAPCESSDLTVFSLVSPSFVMRRTLRCDSRAAIRALNIQSLRPCGSADN